MGMIACAGVLPLVLICGPLRGIPFYWCLIDCLFEVVPLWYCWREAGKDGGGLTTLRFTVANGSKYLGNSRKTAKIQGKTVNYLENLQ